jgi:hypothetical protein
VSLKPKKITKKALATLRKKLIKKADKLCGALVRLRGACENCGSTHVIQWCHGYGRRYLRTRWSTWFTFALCRDCHCKFTNHWEKWVAWMLKKLGHQLFDSMQRQALDPNPITDEEIEVIIEKLQAGLDTARPAIEPVVVCERECCQPDGLSNEGANS